MPQLDINTFTYQYFSIISVLLVTYVTMGYMVLPLVFRVVLIRTKWATEASFINSDISSKLSPVNSVSLLQLTRVNYSQSLNLKNFNLLFLATTAFSATPVAAKNKKMLLRMTISRLHYTKYLGLYLITTALKKELR